MDRTELRSVKRHLVSWGAGQVDPVGSRTGSTGAATVVVTDPGHVAALRESGLVGSDTVVLTPPAGPDSDTDTATATGTVVFDGALDEPGEEASIEDDFFLQTQDYATCQFMSVLGPTLVRVCDPEDFSVFLWDADNTMTKGVFPEFVTAPAVRLADTAALGAGPGIDGPALRLFVDEAGAISLSPAGRRIGEISDTPAELRAAYDTANAASAAPCAVCLAGTVPEDERVPEVTARPWLGRYLAALDGVRLLTAHDLTRVRVSGFGGRFTPAVDRIDDAADLRRSSAPLLMCSEDHDDGRAYVYDPTSERVFRVGPAATTAVEAVLATGSPAAAEEITSAEAVRAVQRFLDDAGCQLLPTATTAKAS